MLKKTLISVLLMTTPAMSADIIHTQPSNDVVYEPQTHVEKAAPISWTGLRLGIHGGMTHGSADAMLGDTQGDLISLDVYNGLFPDRMSADNTSFAGGVDAGFDYQMGDFVVGIAGDYTFTNVDADLSFSRTDPNPNPPFTGVSTNTNYQTRVDTIATARLRLGYAVDDTLMYVTGGIAAAEVENRFELSIPELAYTSPDWSKKGTQTGYVIGAGVEHRIDENWRVSFEVQHIDLGNVNVKAVDEANFPGQEINYEFENKFLLARLGLSYAF